MTAENKTANKVLGKTKKLNKQSQKIQYINYTCTATNLNQTKHEITKCSQSICEKAKQKPWGI